MLYLFISIIGILITIFFVVGTHEFAHFIAARWLGVKVLRFSIGFGKTLFRWYDKSGTEYVFALIPLGGYVKMLDENEESVPADELPRAFNRQPFYKKFLIVLAGPAMNLFCALALYWLVFMIGFITVIPVIGKVTAGSIAEQGGLKANQEIHSIDGKTTSSWSNIIFRLLIHAGNQDQMKIEVGDLGSKQTAVHTLDMTNWHMSELTPDPLSSLGIVPYAPVIPLIIGVIAADSPAQSSSLRIGDKIIAINNKPIKDWNELTTTLLDNPEGTLSFTIERQNKVMTFPVKLGYHRDLFLLKSGYLGISPRFEWPKQYLHKIKYGPITAIPYAWQEIVDLTYFNLLLFGKMITGKLSLQSLGGPITIFESAGDALNYGFLSFIGFLAFLSISIGIINLIPIPGLDGGHLFIYIVELIIRRPIPLHVLSVLYRLGFLFILIILIQAFVNDLMRLYW